MDLLLSSACLAHGLGVESGWHSLKKHVQLSHARRRMQYLPRSHVKTYKMWGAAQYGSAVRFGLACCLLVCSSLDIALAPMNINNLDLAMFPGRHSQTQ